MMDTHACSSVTQQHVRVGYSNRIIRIGRRQGNQRAPGFQGCPAPAEQKARYDNLLLMLVSLPMI